LEAHAELQAPQYKPLVRRAWLAQRWIGVTGVLALALVGLDIAYLSALNNGDATGLGDLQALGYVIQLAVHVLGAGIFLAWFYRAYSNARVLGVPFLRHDRGWAVAAWFVPIIALFWPKRMANDAWRASDPDMPRNDPNWLSRPVAPLVHWWWAAWLVTNFADNVWARLDATTVDEERMATIVAIVGDAAGFAAAVLCILFIRRLTAREEAKAVADVPVLEISEDERLAAQAAARPSSVSGRRVAWYTAGVLLVVLAIGAAVESEETNTSVEVGMAAGYLIAFVLAGVLVVRLVSLAARRRTPLMSGWAALVAVLVAIAVLSVASAQNNDLGQQTAAPAEQPSAELQAVDTSDCEGAAFTPGRLPRGYRYSKARGRERRDLLDEMALTPAEERHTQLLFIMRGGRTAALVTALPDQGEHEAFVKAFVQEMRRESPGRRVKASPALISISSDATLVKGPDTTAIAAGSRCTGVVVLGPPGAQVPKLAKSVLVGA
jgi:hypothetical protein